MLETLLWLVVGIGVELLFIAVFLVCSLVAALHCWGCVLRALEKDREEAITAGNGDYARAVR